MQLERGQLSYLMVSVMTGSRDPKPGEGGAQRRPDSKKKGKCVMDTERKYFPVVQNRIKLPLPFELAHINYIHVDQPTQP